MITTPTAIQAIADHAGVPLGFVRQVARRLREQDELPDNGPGAPSVELTSEQLSLLLVASMAGPFVGEAVKTANRFKKIGTVDQLADYVARADRTDSESSPRLLRLVLDMTNIASVIVDSGAFVNQDGSWADQSAGTNHGNKEQIEQDIASRMISQTVLSGRAFYAIAKTKSH